MLCHIESKRKYLSFLLTAIFFISCSSELKPCKSDMDCKGDRVCRNGLCVGLYENVDTGLITADAVSDIANDTRDAEELADYFQQDTYQDTDSHEDSSELTDTDTCIPDCDEEGKRICQGDGYTECTNINSEQKCLKWVYIPCKAGLECRNGFCGQDECTKGERTCKDGQTYTICQEDQNGFLKNTELKCDAGTICLKKLCCPLDMVEADGFCIDIYEAIVSSAPDCSLKIIGQSGDNYPTGFPDDVDLEKNPPSAILYTCSRAGVLPSRFITYNQAKAVCLLSGKRLCTKDEFILACTGGHSDYYYPYGAQWLQNCNDYSSLPIARETGSMAKCVSDFGVYDLSGNVEEWVEEENGTYSAMGGKAACRNTIGAKCSMCSFSVNYKNNFTDTLLGFRCCK